MKTVVQESIYSFVLYWICIGQTGRVLNIRYEEQQVAPCRFCACAILILNNLHQYVNYYVFIKTE